MPRNNRNSYLMLDKTTDNDPIETFLKHTSRAIDLSCEGHR